MSETIELTVEASDDGKRVDLCVAGHHPDLSRSLITELAREGRVRVNGVTARPSQRVRTGDRVTVDVVRGPSLSATPEDIDLSIVYRDADLVVVDKPPGLVVHPAPGHESGTLANALAGLFPQTRGLGNAERPGIVHRLDKDTSGLLVIALTPAAHVSLQRQIASREAGRTYLALATGHLSPTQGTIEAPIGRDPSDRKRMAVYGVAARPARTSYRSLERLTGFDFLEVTLHTGRTHQIRVHLAALGHPIAGDEVYRGARIPGLSRQFLHAHRLRLRSPSSGEEMEFVSPLPLDLKRVLDALRTD